MKKNQLKIMITGFGGQGIVLAGRILGKAAALGDNKESTLIQSYGPESRGGACSAQVIISDSVIQYPYINNPDILVCMSKEAYRTYSVMLGPQGILITDRDLVKDQTSHFSIPATRMAEELGKTMMANIIMIGFTTAVTSIISKKAAREAVETSVPKGTEKINIKAFTKGYEYGLQKLKTRDKKARTGAA